ncbi:MAG: hypothetical protein A2287_07120 [Candidatus Melainabacteria bacterium RIFOXYA12_FULL_32_12]|nr:MAG: hypothetical protein A2287_07120 [Candidatus Melainabacteria bacterium RIFOXYA12_FULL_32_12]
MFIKKALLAIATRPYIVELVFSKLFNSSKQYAFQQMETSLIEIKEYLLEKKLKYQESPNPYDEELLNLGLSALKLFSGKLNQVLEEIQAD